MKNKNTKGQYIRTTLEPKNKMMRVTESEYRMIQRIRSQTKMPIEFKESTDKDPYCNACQCPPKTPFYDLIIHHNEHQSALTKLCVSCATELQLLMSKIKLPQPELNKCDICGNNSEWNVYTFFPTVVCRECITKINQGLTPEQIKASLPK